MLLSACQCVCGMNCIIIQCFNDKSYFNDKNLHAVYMARLGSFVCSIISLLRQFPKMKMIIRKKSGELYINGFLSPLYAPAKACRLVV